MELVYTITILEYDKPYTRFFFSILWCSWSGDHPYDDLARIGYILHMKVEKKQNPSVFLTSFGNLS
jgi:hypothetical protein